MINEPFWSFIHALINLLSSLVSVLTLGRVWPRWEFNFLMWRTNCYLNKREKEEEGEIGKKSEDA
jgi:hypothetical protein